MSLPDRLIHGLLSVHISYIYIHTYIYISVYLDLSIYTYIYIHMHPENVILYPYISTNVILGYIPGLWSCSCSRSKGHNHHSYSCPYRKQLLEEEAA